MYCSKCVFNVTVMYIAIGKWIGIIGTKNVVEKTHSLHFTINSKETASHTIN